MSDSYRIFGAEMSPYSVKVRAYFRYKQIPHEWIPRTAKTQGEFAKHAKLPIVPLVVTPDGQGMQDSTPIIEALEADSPEPSIHPDDPVAAFASCLLEEFADEWGNKWMFHMRWAREVDQRSSAHRLAALMAPDPLDRSIETLAEQFQQRMTGRVWFVGSNEQNAPQIETSMVDALGMLDQHLASRPYLFGSRPAFADFALWGQVYCLWTDPSGAALIDNRYLNVLAWIQRMMWPSNDGEFEAWDALRGSLLPLLQSQVAGMFLPWSVANAQAIADGAEEFSVELNGNTWTQKPQKYHAKSLAELHAKYARAATAELNALLDETGCRELLMD